MIREVVVRDTDDAPHNNTNPSPPQSPSGPWWNMRWSTLPSVRCTEVGQGAKVSAPASDEFAAVGQLMAVGRRDELVPFGCCCPGLFLGAAGSRVKLAYEQYAQRFPNKLKHCGALRSDKGSLVGFCQLQLAGDPGNLAVQEWARIKLLPDEAYLEWLGTAPSARGKGIGRKMLAWACEKARISGAGHLSLHVKRGSTAARRLFEEARPADFVVKPDPHAERGGAVTDAI
ncbi:hypothetical protein EMIHUDRAFT_198075 [Emiliania huxleyi CCMP1516]|uniref:N-acetyltransferase domain-containing protein n=2 Tax=Emiliania huxleyi TaxID=2903 RepID=A0A0D3IE83_EMIH1|nr:hypothetical protein EMIHUDRAFT_198075 [Emiliania huxleyi CCMP1516]EOD09568.1 hypothetical protein EMIHUDRAFT_198075 [Emiliania huxleyi CCMP1516]|eukprot:XP_005761997.1 hypothetical protein EMIHUDRAFT_198075 [Emiliania huxleyi CCMP1516]